MNGLASLANDNAVELRGRLKTIRRRLSLVNGYATLEISLDLILLGVAHGPRSSDGTNEADNA